MFLALEAPVPLPVQGKWRMVYEVLRGLLGEEIVLGVLPRLLAKGVGDGPLGVQKGRSWDVRGLLEKV
jgi:hypothetical protein